MFKICDSDGAFRFLRGCGSVRDRRPRETDSRVWREKKNSKAWKAHISVVYEHQWKNTHYTISWEQQRNVMLAFHLYHWRCFAKNVIKATVSHRFSLSKTDFTCAWVVKWYKQHNTEKNRSTNQSPKLQVISYTLIQLRH